MRRPGSFVPLVAWFACLCLAGLAAPLSAADCSGQAAAAEARLRADLEAERVGRVLAAVRAAAGEAERARFEELQARFYRDARLLRPGDPVSLSCARWRGAELSECIAAAISRGYVALAPPTAEMQRAYKDSRRELHLLAARAGLRPRNGPESRDPFDAVLETVTDRDGNLVRVLELRALLSEPDPQPRLRWYLTMPGGPSNPHRIQSLEWQGEALSVVFAVGDRRCRASPSDFAAVRLDGPECRDSAVRLEALARLSCLPRGL